MNLDAIQPPAKLTPEDAAIIDDLRHVPFMAWILDVQGWQDPRHILAVNYADMARRDGIQMAQRVRHCVEAFEVTP